VSIRIIDDRDIWDSFVDSCPDKLLFFSWDFLKIIEKHSGYQLLPFGIFDDKKNTMISAFPLFFSKKFGMKFLFSQPPSSCIPYIGFLVAPEFYFLKQRQKESFLGRVVKDIIEEIRKISPNYISLSLGPQVVDVRQFRWNDFKVDVSYSYLIDLTLPLDTIWNSFDKDCRREIRSTEKHNLSFRQTTDSRLFCSVMEDRYHQQGLNFPFFGIQYLNDILAAFPQQVKMYFLYKDDNVIDIVTTYEWNDRVVFWIGWVSMDKTIHSNEFMTWEFIKKARSEGLKLLEIQGGDVERLCLFKSKFNPAIEQSFSVNKKDLIGKASEFLYQKCVKKKVL
jgi:hypothetical protein